MILAHLDCPAGEADDRSLFNGTNLEGWETIEFGGSGEVKVLQGKLIISSGVELSGIRYTQPEKLPTTDYEVEIEARRSSGFDFFTALTFPVGDLKTCATFVVGGWGGGVVGISSINGLDASENNTTSYMHFDEGPWYAIRLRVTATRIEGWIKDQKVVDEDITDKEISLRSGQIDMCAPFGIATFQTTGEIRKCVIRRLP